MRLTLPEEVLLLALRADSGKIEPGTQYQYAIAGAVLAELMLREKVGLDPEAKQPTLRIRDAESLGDPLLDQTLRDIAGASRPKTLQAWVAHVASSSSLKHRTAASLVALGVLRQEEDRILFLFSRTLYPENDPAPELELIGRLESAIFGDQAEVDPRTVILLSLAHQGKLLDIPFSRAELRNRKERVEALIRGEMMGTAAKEAVEAMQAAVMIATTVAATVAATTVVIHH